MRRSRVKRTRRTRKTKRRTQDGAAEGGVPPGGAAGRDREAERDRAAAVAATATAAAEGAAAAERDRAAAAPVAVHPQETVLECACAELHQYPYLPLSQAGMPRGWEACWSFDLRRVYYWNLATNETQWEIPTEIAEFHAADIRIAALARQARRREGERRVRHVSWTGG